MPYQTISRRVTATGYEEAMRLALADWRENRAPGRDLRHIEITEESDPGWRTVRGHLRADFSIVFAFAARS